MHAEDLRKVAGITAGVAVLAFGAIYSVFASLPDLCSNEKLSEALSPSGRWKAVVFARDCGATTDFSTHVAVLKREENLSSSSESAFSADTNHGAASSGPGGGPAVTAYWISESDLVLRHSAMARVHKAVEAAGPVRIKNEQVR